MDLERPNAIDNFSLLDDVALRASLAIAKAKPEWSNATVIDAGYDFAQMFLEKAAEIRRADDEHTHAPPPSLL
jgi:hypothetical protein